MSNQSYLVSEDGTIFSLDLSRQVAVIPLDAEYKRNVINNTIYPDKESVLIKSYVYDNKWTSDCNPNRVNFMKQKLIDEVVKNIDKVNDDFVLGVNYTIYNSSGNILKTGETIVKATASTAVIMDGIDSTNSYEYRKGLVLDGAIRIPVEGRYAYGIKVPTKDYPYTIKINSIKALSTIGEYKYNIESNTQVDTIDGNLNHVTHCHFHIHNPINYPSCTNDLASPFITNAKYGTTLIDSIVTSAELSIPPQYTSVELASVNLNKSGSGFNAVKVENPLREIVIMLEMMIDNIATVFNKESIDSIIILNNQPPKPEPPVEDNTEENDPGEEAPSTGENPDDTSVDDNNGEGTLPDTKDPNPSEGGSMPPTTEETPDNPSGDSGSEEKVPSVGDEEKPKDPPTTGGENPEGTSNGNGLDEEKPSTDNTNSDIEEPPVSNETGKDDTSTTENGNTNGETANEPTEETPSV